MSPNTPTLMPPHTLVLVPFPNTHSSTWDIRPVHSAMGTEEITLTRLQWHALSHIFQYLQAEGTVNVTFVLRCHTNTHTLTVSVTIQRALPVRVFHLVSVFSTDCGGGGVSLLAVLMWRDDTCGRWIERHKGFQIGNMEWWGWWVVVLFLLFFLPRGIFGTHQP